MSAYLPHRARVRTFLVLADLLGLALAAWCSYHLRFDVGVFADKWSQLLALPGLLAWAGLSAVALSTAAELYEPEILYRRWETVVRVAVTLTVWGAAMALASFLIPAWNVGRGVLFLTAGLWVVAMVATRWLMTSWMRGRTRFDAMVIGEPDAVADFCDALDQRPSSPWRAVPAAGLRAEDIVAEIERRQASFVVLAGVDGHADMGHDLAALHFSGVPVVAASEIWAWLEERLPLEALSPALFLHQPGFGAVHWTLFNRATRIADVLLACLMLVLSAPLFLAAALVVVVVDGFPVLYRQTRLGQYGRPFTMLKLRTMRRDAERDGPAFATERDPRVVPFGGLLRHLRIDELPQLVNVLKGEMSLVGPRPERPEFAAELAEDIPFYAFRMAVPPGLTGWAQVNTAYARSLEDHQRKLEYDLYFIRERSVRLYILTLLRTASAALVGTRRPRHEAGPRSERSPLPTHAVEGARGDRRRPETGPVPDPRASR